MSSDIPALGWWAIQGEELLAMLRRCAADEDPDLVYAEAVRQQRPRTPRAGRHAGRPEQ